MLPLLSSMREKDYIFIKEFDADALEQFIADFSRLEADPQIQIIVIYISSYGGEAYALAGMRDIIKSSPKPVSTICIGMAMSCGAFLLASGTKGYRFCSPTSEIMVHEVASGSAPGTKASEMMQDAYDTARLNDRFFKNFAEDTGNELSEIQEHMKELKNNDWNLSAQEAKKWGIIDHIGAPRVGMTPQVNYLATDVVAKKKKKKPIKKDSANGKDS